MRTDAEIRRDGYQAIFEKLDIVEAQRFIGEQYSFPKSYATSNEIAVRAIRYH